MDDKDKKLRGKLEGLFSDLPAATQPEPAPGAPPAEAPCASSVLPTGEPSAVFRAVVEHTSDAVAVSDLAGRLIYCNHTCYALFGYDETRQELANLPADVLWPDDQKDRLTNEILPQAMAGRTAWHGEAMQRRKDGSSFSAALTLFSIRDAQGQPLGQAILIRDITERHTTVETTHKQLQRQYQLILDSVPEAIVVIDTDTGKFTDANENAVLLYGLSREELLKVGPADMSPPTQPDGRPSLKASMEIMQQALKGGMLVVEWMHRNSTGQDILCEARLVRMPAADRNLVCASIIDITSCGRTELERERLLQDIQARAQRDQLINAMVARVRASLTVEQVLAATVEEIGAALGAARVAVRLDMAGGPRRGNEAR